MFSISELNRGELYKKEKNLINWISNQISNEFFYTFLIPEYLILIDFYSFESRLKCQSRLH